MPSQISRTATRRASSSPNQDLPARKASQRAHALDLMKPGEDWRNLPNSAERRKIQNRIAQRSYRRSMQARKAEIEHLKQQLKEARGSPPAETQPPPCNSFVDPSANVTRDQDHFLALRETHAASLQAITQRAINSENTTQPFDYATPDSQTQGPAHSALPDKAFATTSTTDNVTDSNSENMIPSPHHLQKTSNTCPEPLHTTPLGCEAVRDKGEFKALIQDHTSLPESIPLNVHTGSSINGEEVGWETCWPWSTPEHTTNAGRPCYVSARSGMSASVAFPQHHVGLQEPPSIERSLLHLAISSGSCEVLEMLLQDDEIFIDQKDASGMTPLQRAVILGRPDMVSVLLDHGADVSGRQ